MDKERLKRFAYDNETNEAVYNFLLEFFLKEQSKDVNVLASSFLAVDKLRKAWEALAQFRRLDDSREEKKNAGL